LSLTLAFLRAFALTSTTARLHICHRHWGSGSRAMAGRLSKAANTRWGLTRTSGRSIVVDNITRCRYTYGHAIPQNTATRTHAHHLGHPARVVRRPVRQREQRAAIPAVDQPVQTVTDSWQGAQGARFHEPTHASQRRSRRGSAPQEPRQVEDPGPRRMRTVPSLPWRWPMFTCAARA